jgi:tetratricopeptide (TPR) repeat protein
MRVVSFAAAISLAVFWLGGPPRALAQESQIEGLRAAAKASPGDPLAALALGIALRRADHLSDALAELRRGVATTGKPEALRQLYWEILHVQEARRDFLQALAACKPLKATAEAHACTAFAHLVRQRATEALEETGIALARDPRSYEAKLAEGKAYELELDLSKSESSLREAISIRGDLAESHEALGGVLLKQGRRDEAVAELRQATTLDPSGPAPLYDLAIAVAPGGESVGLLERATRERPTFLDAWLALGNQQLTGGRTGEARRAAEASLKIDPRSAAAYVLSGKVALAEGRTDDAINAGQAALRIVGNSAAAKLLVADGNARKGEIDAALEAYQAAFGLDHADPTPLVHASEACHSAGRDTSARAFGVRAIQEFPKWAPGWAALGDALAAQAEAAGARDAYRKALALDGPIDRDAVARRLSALR